MNNMETKIAGISFKNPIMTASGTFGCGREFADFFDISKLGAIVTKTVTRNQREGNLPPRTAETSCGMLNAIGLENKGLEYFIENEIPFLKKINTHSIVSISADNTNDFCYMAEKLEQTKAVSALEINMSCPNLGHKPGKMCAQDTSSVKNLISELKSKTNIPLIAKLSPNVTDITEIALSAQEAGADAVSLINTFPAMAVNIDRQKPVLGNITGGLSGPAIKPIALKMVWDCYKVLDIPIIGIGGIMNWQDAVEFILCGASAVQVGTANLVNPNCCGEILQGVNNYLQKNNCSISDIKGKLKV